MQKLPRSSLLVLALLAALRMPVMAQAPVPAGKSAGSVNAEAANHAEAIRRRAPSPEQVSQAGAPAKLSGEAAAMLRQAAAVSRALVDAGRVGVRRAVDPAVQGLAQSLVTRHQALMQEAQALARQHQLRLAGTAATGAQLARLSSTGGFDTVFVREVGIDMQTKALARQGNPLAWGNATAAAAWHAKYLDALRDGLSDAQQLPLRNAPDKTPRSSSGDPAAPPAPSASPP